MINDAQQQRDRVFAISVVERLRAAGYEALWAGGCVRDLLLGHAPSDYDVATSATPGQVRELFGRRKTLAVGAAFGVIIVLDDRRDVQQIEVATFRTDIGYSDGRRPDSVKFSTAKEDAQRRDFTINGMFYDPIAAKVLDYVGGQADLERGMVRAIGQADQRIGEDKLRMLRAIRFAARFDFELESATRAAVTGHAAEIQVVSGERIAMEVAKTLQTKRAAWAVESWQQTGLLEHILPEVGIQWPAHQDQSLRLLDAACRTDGVGTDWRLRLATLLYRKDHQLTELVEIIQSLRGRLKLANEDADAIHFALSAQVALQAAALAPWSSIQPYLIQTHADIAVGLLAAREQLGEVDGSNVDWLNARLAWPSARLNPPPLIVGGDLIALGLRPGPNFSDLLGRVRAMQLDEQLSDRQAAIDWLRTAK